MRIYCLFLLTCFLGWPVFSQCAEKTPKKVLVISSFSPIRENGNNIIASFSQHLGSEMKVEIAIEYMDSEAFSDFDYWVEWMSSLFHAYEDNPDVVVIIGQEVWATYRKCCIGGWKNIPVVLGSVKKGFVDYAQQKGVSTVDSIPLLVKSFDGFKVTGYYLTDYLEENIRLIRSLEPDMKNLAFCYDNRYHHLFLSSYLERIVENIGGIRLHRWMGSELSTKQLADSIIGVGKDFAIMSAGWYTDMNHYAHAYSMLGNRLFVHPDKYVYQTFDQDFLNPNNMGGYFVSGKDIGKDLGELTQSVLLKGIENSPAFQKTPSAPRYYLNHGLFKKIGLEKESLPSGVVWYNTEPDFVEEHTVEIIFGIVFLVLVVLFSILLHLYRERHYKRSNREMKQLLRSMPDMVIIFNAQRRIIDILNPMSELLFDHAKEDVIGHDIQELCRMFPKFEELGKQIDEYIRLTLTTREIHSFNCDVPLEGRICYSEIKTVPFEKDQAICFIHNISSRVFAEKEVIKYKNFLNSIIDNLPVGIFVKDASDDFRYIYFNQKGAEFNNKHFSVFLGENDFTIGDPLAVQYREEDEAVLRSDVALSNERAMEAGVNGKRFGIVTKKRLIGEDGAKYIIGILVDVTEMRRKEMELDNIRRELSMALDAGSLSVWIYNVDRHFFSSVYREALVGQGTEYSTVSEIIHPDDREKYRNLIGDLVEGKGGKKKEVLRAYKNGKLGWYEIHAIAIRSTDTGQIDQVVGIEKDITEELCSQRELEASKFKTELVISSNGIVQWDYDVVNQIFSSPNPESFMHEGMTKEKFVQGVYPEDIGIFDNALERMITKEEKSLNVQMRTWLPDKGFRWVDIHAVIFQEDQQGNVIQITGLRRDVTEWRNVTEELIMLRDKAEESNRLKTAFLANMSHEIRTPLNAIVGFSNLISQTEDPEEKKEFCGIIEANNELLLQLVNDILDLSKIEAGQLDFVYSNIDVRSMFENLEQIYRFRVKEGVELISEMPDGDYVIHSEKNRLTQVVSNFLSNACKFTFKGYVKMGFELVPDGLRFFVSDTGKGISKEDIPYVFDRFMKFDAFIQGTGLGLSICQTIVKHLGGEIGAESEVGKGSTFWFTIPCLIEEKNTLEPRPSEISNPQSSPLPSDGRKMILVAEDNDSNYLLMSSMLRKDYDLKRAVNGQEAVELFRQSPPDLVFMDIRMPLMNGIQAIEEIRKEDQETPIVVLSANAFDEDREKAFKAGCNDYLAKPVELSLLRNVLAKYFKDNR